MKLHEVRPPIGSRRAGKRVGRGPSAGGGKTAGRGQKGQGARTSYSLPRAFEGGQMPLSQRVPKLRGFKNRWRIAYQVINCGSLSRFDAGTEVSVSDLVRTGLIRTEGRPVKLLAGGGPPARVNVTVDRASRAALAAMAEAGAAVRLRGESESQSLAAAPDDSSAGLSAEGSNAIASRTQPPVRNPQAPARSRRRTGGGQDPKG